jgi:E3 ubiquitin-protein ligase listerin
MSKKSKASASAASARAASTGLTAFGFGSPSSIGFQTTTSSLSYIAEQPDLSTISNAQLVVILRNLGKKDSTTKSKALEELQEHLKSVKKGDELDSSLLDAWVG